MFDDLDKLNQLSCEIIELFNRFGIDDYYGIMLPDKYYNSLHGWEKPKDPYRYVCKGEVLWNKNFNMILEANVYTMLNEHWSYIYEICDYSKEGTQEAKQMIRCHALLRRIFRRHNLEWDFINQGFGLTFREVIQA